MNTKITPFGKLVRQLRIEGEIHMKQMADAIGVSIAQLSAVETGRRPLTDKYVLDVTNFFRSMRLNTDGIRAAADQSIKSITMDLSRTDPASKQLVSSFARRFTTLSEEEKKKIADLLNSN